MAKPLHVVVDVGILFDIRIGLRYVGFRLVVVVIRNEIAHRIVWHEFTELGAQLRRQRFIRFNDQRRALQTFNKPCCGGGFASSGGAHEHYIVLTVFNAFRKLFNRLGLVAARLIWRFDHKRFIHAFDVESHAYLASMRHRFISISICSNICSNGCVESMTSSAMARRCSMLD